MITTRLRPVVCILLLLLLLNIKAYSQCVVINTEYQYNVTGNLSGASNIQWCIEGGLIVGSDSLCKTGTASFLRVKWNSNATSISIKAGNNEIVRSVKITKALEGGNIDSTVIQESKNDAPPTTLYCSDPTGGSCNPKYEYQWEKSSDGMNWQKIAGATSPQLSFSDKLKQTTYYRRKVIETVSQTESVSNTAIIMIKPEKKNPS